jgi:hypothetical protein
MAGLNDAKPSSKAFVRKLLAMHDGDLESALPEGVRRLKSSHGADLRDALVFAYPRRLQRRGKRPAPAPTRRACSPKRHAFSIEKKRRVGVVSEVAERPPEPMMPHMPLAWPPRGRR